MKNKGFIAVAAAVLAAGLTVGACGGGSASTPSDTTSTSPPSINQVFIVAACNAANKVGVGQYVCVGSAEDALIAAGQSVCSGFAIGSSVAGQVQSVEEDQQLTTMPVATASTLNTDTAIADAIVVAAAEHFCPEYLSVVKAYASGDTNVAPVPSSSAPVTKSGVAPTPVPYPPGGVGKPWQPPPPSLASAVGDSTGSVWMSQDPNSSTWYEVVDVTEQPGGTEVMGNLVNHVNGQWVGANNLGMTGWSCGKPSNVVSDFGLPHHMVNCG
jgi:hypothetical protein